MPKEVCMKVALTFNFKRDFLPGIDPKSLPPDYFAECDSAETIEAMRAALAEFHEVILVEADENAYGKFRDERPDIVFNVAEGLWGAAREGQIPAMLELLRIPYTGSDPTTMAICLDKSRTKEILSWHGIPTASWQQVDSLEEIANLVSGNGAAPPPGKPLLTLPLIVKPLGEGSSKGIRNSAVVRNPQELECEIAHILSAYRQPAIIEEYLSGREFTVAMIGNDEQLEVLPIVEIRFDRLPGGVNPIYSYEAKWVWDTCEHPIEIFECPAKLAPDLRGEIESACLRTWRALRIRDWARIDVRLDAEERPRILEVNPIPGILPLPEQNSCFPKAARAAGMSYEALVNRTLDVAAARLGLTNSSRRAASACKP
jgi:D-alanine-D-alanine ligase